MTYTIVFKTVKIKSNAYFDTVDVTEFKIVHNPYASRKINNVLNILYRVLYVYTI